MTFIATKTQSMAPDGRRGGLVVGLRRTATGEVYTLEARPRRWVLGSEGSCDVQIAGDAFVSGVHCVLERKPNGVLVVRDRNSRNGTYVDGNPIEGAELRVGSYLSIGRTTLVAVAGAGSAAQPRALELLRGRDPVLRKTVEQGLKAAITDCSVLILGETGTGKDLLARVIHESSRRNSGPFVAVNCGAIPRELIASELFGHEKGAFTGATDARDGYFMEANGGTLFLDEMGELPIELQAHLLRVLETKTVRRVGSSVERPVNVRIVAATNRTEGLGTESGRLRSDLYHRLATVVLSLPPLRERMTDLPELVDALLDELTPDFGRKEVTDEAWASLQSYAWPGNVRELRHAVARAVTLGADILEAEDFFPEGMGPRKRPDVPLDDEIDPLLAPYESMMRGAMEKALIEHGSIRAAAAALGMPKSTFADRARQYGISIRRRTRAAQMRRRVIGLTPAFSQPLVPRNPRSVPGTSVADHRGGEGANDGGGHGDLLDDEYDDMEDEDVLDGDELDGADGADGADEGAEGAGEGAEGADEGADAGIHRGDGARDEASGVLAPPARPFGAPRVSIASEDVTGPIVRVDRRSLEDRQPAAQRMASRESSDDIG